MLANKIYNLKLILILASIVSLISCDETVFSTDTIDGTWECLDIHEDMGERSYFVDIEYNPNDSSYIYIYNFLGLSNDINTNLRVSGVINGSTVTIPKQLIDSHEVEGSGDIASNKKTITIDYTDLLYDTPWSASVTLTKH